MMRLWEIPRVEGLTKKKIMYSGDDVEDPMNDLSIVDVMHFHCSKVTFPWKQ